MGMVKLYDVYKNDYKILSAVSLKEIEKELNISTDTARIYARSFQKTKEGYEFVDTGRRVRQQGDKTEKDWSKEWNRVRFSLNPNAKRVSN